MFCTMTESFCSLEFDNIKRGGPLMVVTLLMVLDWIAEYNCQNRIPQSDYRTYRWVSLLPADGEVLCPDYLYVCMLSDWKHLSGRNAGIHFVCICNREEEPELNETEAGLILIQDLTTQTTLFNRLQEKFLQISEWREQMQAAVIERCDYQRLMDMCESILGNSIYVMNASYELICHTTHVMDDEEINHNLLKTGFHSEETMQTFKKYHIFESHEQNLGIIIHKPGVGTPIKYPTVGKWFRYDNVPLIHVVMICNNIPPTPGLVDRFKLLLEFLQICFLRNLRAGSHTGQIYDTLLNDMLYSNLTDTRIIAQQASLANIPMTGNFLVYKIAFRIDLYLQRIRVAREFTSCLTNARLVVHEHEVVLWSNYGTKSAEEASQSDLERMYPLLEKYNALCGVSEPFSEFIKLYMAFVQATQALEIGETMIRSEKRWGVYPKSMDASFSNTDHHIFYYRDYCMFHMFSAARDGFQMAFRETRYYRSLFRILQNDRERGTNNMEILYTYLTVDRCAAAAGKLLNMHRNNVLYRISKIEELLHLRLEEQDNRLKLLNAYYFLRMETAWEQNELFRQEAPLPVLLEEN